MIPDRSAESPALPRTGRPRSGARAFQASVAALAAVFLALHLPYLPSSLEDLDSINFALGLRQFDVAHHQPHPPGYPLFIAMAKVVHAVVPAEETALALVSVIGGALGVIALAGVFRRVDAPETPHAWSIAAIALAITTPLYWFTAIRPLSDSAGLTAALAVQAMTLAAQSPGSLAAAAFCAGLAAGLRSQVVWLTVPLLILQGLRAQGSELKEQGAGLAPSGRLAALSLQPLALPLILFLMGLLIWLVPLVAVSGGPAAYWHALFDQGAEDLGNIQMLWTRHGLRDIVDAFYYAFVAPWAVWPVAALALTCAFAGLVRLAARQRQTLLLLAAAFLPYLAFDLLFQETFTSRYALPLVAPMAYLVVAGLRALPWDTGLAVAIGLIMFCAHLGGTSIAAQSRAAAPAFRLLEAMQSAAPNDRAAPVLAMDRRESLDLRRPMTWMGDRMPILTQTLPAPPQHAWLEAVKYWNGGGRAPVWFVVDPMRTSIDLVQHGAPSKFRWTVPYPVLLGGARPGEMDWYRVDRPEWYLGEGWALTPEAAGVAAADRRGPSLAPIAAWLRPDIIENYRGGFLIGGRNLDPTSAAGLIVRIGGAPVIDERIPPGAFLTSQRLPLALVDPFNHRDYLAMTVEASPGSNVAIEQFDASRQRPMLGFGAGFHEPEFNPETGLRWRWLSERGELSIVPNVPFESSPVPLILHLEGESSRKHFSRDSILNVRVGNRLLMTMPVGNDFSVDVSVPATSDQTRIVLETDQTYVPAERSRRSQDRRRLGLRVFKAEIRTATRPAS